MNLEESEDIEVNWKQIKAGMERAIKQLPKNTVKRKDWISTESWSVMEQRRKAKLDQDMDEYRQLNKKRNQLL